ncbi:MAG: CAP domain-containing protein [Thermoanaerobaculum sp.]
MLLSASADPLVLARTQVLALVNEARSQHGLAPLAPDPLLQKVGDAFCRKLLAEERSGHFGSDGVAPYLRYVLAGGTGFHRENVGSYQTTGTLSPEAIPQLAVELTKAMLDEKPPADGHRRTLLVPEATHLGVGLAFSQKRLVLTHEVATQLAELSAPAVICQPKGPLVLSGRLPAPWQPAAMEVLWEPLPGAGPVPGGDSYSYPPRRGWFQPQEFLPGTRVTLPGALSVHAGGRFEFRSPTGPHAGVELLVLWAQKPGTNERYPVALSGCLVLSGAPNPNMEFWMALQHEESP